MAAAATRASILGTYRQLLRASKHYPSRNASKITAAIREEYRANRTLSGEEATGALWLAEMELKRLQAWIPTSVSLRKGDSNFDVNL